MAPPRKYPSTKTFTCNNQKCGKEIVVLVPYPQDSRKARYCNDDCRRAHWAESHGKNLRPKKQKKHVGSLWGNKPMTEEMMDLGTRFSIPKKDTKKYRKKVNDKSRITERDVEYWRAYRAYKLGVSASVEV